ncbi:MAG: hypothetical protein RML45_13755 [Acetobacteraceae bacterium]|nr:hypothetical protein [Acetobacteraceae bacterium]
MIGWQACGDDRATASLPRPRPSVLAAIPLGLLARALGEGGWTLAEAAILTLAGLIAPWVANLGCIRPCRLRGADGEGGSAAYGLARG